MSVKCLEWCVAITQSTVPIITVVAATVPSSQQQIGMQWLKAVP